MFKSMTPKMIRIAKMEFRLTARNKAFVIITIIGPFLIAAISILPTLLATGSGGGVEGVTIGVTGPSDAINTAVATALEGAAVTVSSTGVPEAQLRQALANESIDGYLVLPGSLQDNSARYVSGGSPNLAFVGMLDSVIGSTIVTMRLSDAGLDPALVQELSSRPSLEVTRFDSSAGDAALDPTAAIFTVLAFTMMLYMTILLYGQAIGRSVLNEKLSKTVEIMLSSVSPRELLVGKIIGKAAASILQYAIWILMAMAFVNLVGPLVGLEINLAGGTATYLYLVGFFLLAFLLYSTIYAALGAASEDETHLAQLAWPVIFFLVIPMISIGAMATSPDSAFPRVLSIFPLTAPIVMFQRLLVGNPAVWEVALSVGLLLASIVIIARLAAKIFRIGILMTGKRFNIGEVLRWVRFRE